MRWVLLLLAAALALVVVGWLVSALKMLLIFAAFLVFIAVLVGWRPGDRSTRV